MYSIYEALKKPIRAYRVIISEMIASGSTIVEASIYDNTSDVYYVWDSKFDRSLFSSYNQSNYIVNSSTVASFLTNKPNNIEVNDFSTEQLYFITDKTKALKILIQVFNT